MNECVAYRASIFTFTDGLAYEYFPDGIVLVEKGVIQQVAPAQSILSHLPSNVRIEHYPDRWIFPGFVDTHTHFPQTEVVASYGEQLLNWLDKYVYKEEIKYRELAYATAMAKQFIQRALASGTTAMAVFPSSHPYSVDALFREAQRYSLAIISGQVLMDRNAPQELIDTEQNEQTSEAMIEKWHKCGRIRYALTPRFALTSTEKQLTWIKRLLEKYPDVYLQTHLAENKEECKRVRALYQKPYLAVYQHFGFLRKNSLFAHAIHLKKREYNQLAKAEVAISFCPCSNLLLGSGLLDYQQAKKAGVTVGLGSDVGAGNHFSLFRHCADAYKILQLQQQVLSPLEMFYLITLGGAKALNRDDEIGSLTAGKKADFIVLNSSAYEPLQRRLQSCTQLEERLFAIAMLGDSCLIEKTFVNGQQVFTSI